MPFNQSSTSDGTKVTFDSVDPTLTGLPSDQIIQLALARQKQTMW